MLFMWRICSMQRTQNGIHATLQCNGESTRYEHVFFLSVLSECEKENL